jgi:hypothetical protein
MTPHEDSSSGGRSASWAILALLSALLMSVAGCATSQTSAVAVVFGDNYEESSKALKNAETDALEVHEALKELGYTSKEPTGDLTALAGETELDNWLDQDDVIGENRRVDQLVFYFAGHGESRNKQNYLVSSIGSGSDEHPALELQTVLEVLTKRAKRVIMLIDACRDRGEGFGDGFVSEQYRNPNKNAEFYILFSTGQNTKALDELKTSEGKVARGNSPFASAVLKHLPVRSLSLSQFSNAVREETKELTDGAQIPESYVGIGSLHLDPNYRPWHATP